MNFSGLKKLTIQGMELKRLFIGGLQVWKSGHTNLLPMAKDTDRTTIYNGIGYKTATRLSSSGVTASAANMCASGFIAAQAGDVLRVQGIDHSNNTNEYVIAYSPLNVKTGYIHVNSAAGGALGIYDSHVTENAAFTLTLTEELLGTGFDAIRFSAGGMDENTVVTINEEISQ